MVQVHDAVQSFQIQTSVDFQRAIEDRATQHIHEFIRFEVQEFVKHTTNPLSNSKYYIHQLTYYTITCCFIIFSGLFFFYFTI
jgi:hypothetical protein